MSLIAIEAIVGQLHFKLLRFTVRRWRFKLIFLLPCGDRIIISDTVLPERRQGGSARLVLTRCSLCPGTGPGGILGHFKVSGGSEEAGVASSPSARPFLRVRLARTLREKSDRTGREVAEEPPFPACVPALKMAEDLGQRACAGWGDTPNQGESARRRVAAARGGSGCCTKGAGANRDARAGGAGSYQHSD